MEPADRRAAERERTSSTSGAPASSAPSSGGRPAGAPVGGMGPAAYAGLGIELAVSLVAFYYLGQWLDRRLGTAPVFLLGCVFAGAGATFYAVYLQLMKAQRREEAAIAAAKAAAAAADARARGTQP